MYYNTKNIDSAYKYNKHFPEAGYAYCFRQMDTGQAEQFDA